MYWTHAQGMNIKGPKYEQQPQLSKIPCAKTDALANLICLQCVQPTATLCSHWSSSMALYKGTVSLFQFSEELWAAWTLCEETGHCVTLCNIWATV